MLKEAPAAYVPAFVGVAKIIGYPDRETKVIAIEGIPSSGKTSLASWLSWQTGMPSIHLDLFIESSEDGVITWRSADLIRALNARLDRPDAPVLVEGVFCLEALNAVGVAPDWVILVENSNNDASGSIEARGRAIYASDDFQKRVSARVDWNEPDGKTMEDAAADLARLEASLITAA